MKDYRDKWFVKRMRIKDLVDYLEDENVKKQYKDTLGMFGVVEQEVYPVEIVSDRKLKRQFRGLIRYWDNNGAVVNLKYMKVYGKKEDYVLKVEIYYY